MVTYYKLLIFQIVFVVYSGNLLASSVRDCLQTTAINMNLTFKVRKYTSPITGVLGPKIEIGGARTPMCSDCIQVDRNSGPKDMWKNIAEKAAGRKLTDEEFLNTFQGERYLNRPKVQNDDFAAKNQKGVIADAGGLPFQSNSVAMIVAKNFPWFRESYTVDVIKPILIEYKRILKDGGRIFALANGSTNWRSFELHKSIGESLGLKITYIEITNPISSGILLEKIRE